MEPNKLLILNGVRHDLNMVLQNSRSAPLIDVDVSTVSMGQSPDAKDEYAVVLQPDQPELHKREVVLFKHGAGYLVLLGKNKVTAAVADGATKLKGRLVSTPMLKKCRVQEAVPEQRTTSYYRDERREPFNAPRFSRDDRREHFASDRY